MKGSCCMDLQNAPHVVDTEVDLCSKLFGLVALYGEQHMVVVVLRVHSRHIAQFHLQSI